MIEAVYLNKVPLRKVASVLILAVVFLFLTNAPVFGAQQLATSAEVAAAEAAIETTSYNLDTLWVLIAAAMVFLMQSGFLCFEVGCVQPKSITAVAMKNVVDWSMVSVLFFVFGFGLMFGNSLGLIGGDGFLLNGLAEVSSSIDPFVFFLFQLAFAATAATIVSGAMSERTGFVTYLLVSAVIGALIYPVFGHWAWGNLLNGGNETFLTRLGFIDFAGSTVVHSVGGWVALVGIWFLGPRLGRFDSDGKPNPIQSYNWPFTVLGVFILWFGWWGFNGGSTLALNSDVGVIIVNTLLAAASAGLAAFVHCWYAQGRDGIYGKFLGGILGGLVAITACCSVVTPAGALVVGITAGIIHNLGFDFVSRKLKLDDPVGAVPVHLICGIYGTLCVALFGQADLLANPRLQQLGVQLVGILACMVWTVSLSVIMFKVLEKTVGLRVSPQEEIAGISFEHDVEYDAGGESVDAEALAALLGDIGGSQPSTDDEQAA